VSRALMVVLDLLRTQAVRLFLRVVSLDSFVHLYLIYAMPCTSGIIFSRLLF
jgi:hypothetical protein